MSGSTPAPDVETLAGLVERVTFRNEENGFSVLKVKARGHRELVSVVGTVPEITPGEWVEATGHWEQNPRHGPQFFAAELHLSRPDTLEGIEKYLGSGLIRGIGPVYAEKLVRAFGRDVFDVIENRSGLLLEVEGIGPQRRESIRAAWAEQKAVRGIMTFLFSHGVSTGRAFRIYRMYGDAAIERVRMDPYCLARDIHGIGFKTADAVAARLGIPKDSPLRARAGVEHALQELADEGHCACLRETLVEETARALEVDLQLVAEAVEYGLTIGRLVERVSAEGERMIFLSWLDVAESELARLLAARLKQAPPLGSVDVAKALAWVEGKLGFTLEAVQREAVAGALHSPVMVITGGPGVGKTTIVRAIVRIFEAKKKRVVLCAPTGRAAKRLSESTGHPAKTIHRLLAFDPKTSDFRHHARNRLQGDLFVVDETSMMDVQLSHHLLRALPDDAALIWVGDADQLPSVGPGRVLGDLIESEVLPVCRLRHVFRQAQGSHIITNAHRINEGLPPETPERVPGKTQDFYFIAAEDPARLVRQLVQLVQESIPRRFGLDPFNDVQVLTPMQRGELGARNLNTVLQAALNPHGPAVERFGVVYRRGDKVMQIENDYDKDVYNGDLGRIAWVDEASQTVQVRFEERTLSYAFHELDELVLAYACTIHKSQGSEYPCVVVPFHTQHYVMLRRNLLYTAVTRARRLVVLMGSSRAVSMAVRQADAGRRLTLLKERLRTAVSDPAPPRR